MISTPCINCFLDNTNKVWVNDTYCLSASNYTNGNIVYFVKDCPINDYILGIFLFSYLLLYSMEYFCIRQSSFV